MAIAVTIDDGLVVPVIHDADRLDLAAVSARRATIVSAAREGRLRPEDVSGGTFTISNLGLYGVDSFDAIVNAPQAAILAVGRINDRVVPVDGLPGVRPVAVALEPTAESDFTEILRPYYNHDSSRYLRSLHESQTLESPMRRAKREVIALAQSLMRSEPRYRLASV